MKKFFRLLNKKLRLSMTDHMTTLKAAKWNSKTLIIELPWQVSTNIYYRHGQGRTRICKEGILFKNEVAVLFSRVKGKPLFKDGPIELIVKLYPPDLRKRDIDNHCGKSLLDAMEGLLYSNDTQVKKLTAEMLDPFRPTGKVEVKARRLIGRSRKTNKSGKLYTPEKQN